MDCRGDFAGRERGSGGDGSGGAAAGVRLCPLGDARQRPRRRHQRFQQSLDCVARGVTTHGRPQCGGAATAMTHGHDPRSATVWRRRRPQSATLRRRPRPTAMTTVGHDAATRLCAGHRGPATDGWLVAGRPARGVELPGAAGASASDARRAQREPAALGDADETRDVRFACAGALEYLVSHRTSLARLFVCDEEERGNPLPHALARELDIMRTLHSKRPLSMLPAHGGAAALAVLPALCVAGGDARCHVCPDPRRGDVRQPRRQGRGGRARLLRAVATV